jgi:hypothetical protein
MVVEGQDRRVEVGQGVEVDQARRQDGVAEIVALGHLAAEAMTDEQDAALVEHDLAVGQQVVAAVRMPQHPACPQMHRPIGGTRRHRPAPSSCLAARRTAGRPLRQSSIDMVGRSKVSLLRT